MIDFRYHVVSIIAVFLALSVGLVLGSSFLADLAKEDLNERIEGLRGDLKAARENNTALDGENGKLNTFIGGAKPDLVADKLKGKSVVLVNLPDADSDVTNATVKTMEESGATVTGVISLKSNWIDPAKESALADAVASDVTGATSYDRAAAALAAALVHKTNTSTTPPGGATTTPGTTTPPGSTTGTPGTPPSGGATNSATNTPNPGATSTPPTGGTPNGDGNGSGNGTTESASLAALNRLKSAGFIDIKGNPEKGATLAVVVAASGPVKVNDPARANSIYLGLSRTLDASDDGTVMAGDATSAQDGGTVFALRRDDRTLRSVSSVDAADTSAGQVSVDWALVVEAEGRSGQYGLTGPDGWLPELPVKKPEKTEKSENTS